MTIDNSSQEEKASSRKESTILIVDDSATFRSLTRRMLHSFGYCKIIDCASAEDALKQLKTQSVDLIISDWTMPGMSGLDLFHSVRADDRFKELPFVVVTANQDRRTELVASKAGILSFLVKPLCPETLAKKLAEVLTG